ncbi:SpaA isopeptide-forming pilin-related protein [Enterococcus hermanniensis]|nr:SpaA isopeptide-forming pilin-related protein [Enterococcus hermanniensis]
MKKKYWFIVGIFLLSYVWGVWSAVVPSYASATKTELIQKDGLNLSYEYSAQENTNRWRILFSRKSEAENSEQCLKLKILDEKGQTIAYPVNENMVVEEDWLVEKNYSASFEDELMIELPKSTKKLHLLVQMYERTTAKKQNKSSQKTIEKINDSFELTIQDASVTTIEANENDSTSEETETLSSEEFIGPREVTPVSATTVPYNGLTRITPKSYTNKEPDYTTVGESIYPTHSWQPIGQTAVLNHQGGDETSTTWDGLTSWDTSANNYENSYINYGVATKTPDISLRKYASEAAKADEFTVRLNVRGNTIAKSGVDICIVMDNSRSMILTEGNIGGKTKKALADSALQKLIDKFKAAELDAGSLRIGGIIYSSSEDPKFANQTIPMSEAESDWQGLVNAYKNSTSNGNTYTQKALMDAQSMLNASGNPERQKVIFLMTDGAPNYSVEPLEGYVAPSIYYDGMRFTKYNQNTIATGSNLQGNPAGGFGIVYIPLGHRVTGISRLMYSHLTPMNSTAADIREQGMEIHTIAINVQKTLTSEVHTTADLVKGLYRVASKKANTDEKSDNASDYLFHNISTTGEFETSFEEWFNSVIYTVNKGKITDPIGEMFELVGTPKVTEVKKADVPAIEASKMANDPVVSDKTITVENINLYDQQEIQLEYTVRLKKEADGYQSNTWYQLNGRTILEPTPEKNNVALDFGVPSAREKEAEIQIPVEKKWVDKQQTLEDYWTLRAASINVSLQKKQVDGDWQSISTKNLTGNNDWRGYFTVKKDDAIYRVVEEKRVTGYEKASINSEEFTVETLPTEGIILTNKLMLTEASFYKYGNDGKTPFDKNLPTFKVIRKADQKELIAELTPDSSGQVKISNLPLGEFIIEETNVPTGHVKMSEIELKVTENQAGTGLNVTMDGEVTSLVVTNKLKDFTLKVHKLDQNEKELAGASFRLEGTDYDERVSSGTTFIFKGLRPGTYRLTEVGIPEGYKGLKDPVMIQIFDDGTVSIPTSPNVAGSGSVGTEKNLITVKVKNQKQPSGILPQTGSTKRIIVTRIAFGAFGIGSLLSIVYSVYRRKYR